MASLFEKKPSVPRISPIDVGQQQSKALQSNIQNFPLTEQLFGMANQLGISQALDQIDAALGPGTRELIGKNITAGLKGQLPEDVVRQIRQRQAEMGITSGTTGSGFNQNLGLRDLGLTSLQRTDAMLGAAQQWTALATSRMPQFDFASTFVSPQMYLQQANINQQNQFNRDWMANQINAAYSKGSAFARDIRETDQMMSQLIMSVGGSALGGAMGGMMGGGGGSSSYSPPPSTYSTMNTSNFTYGLPTNYFQDDGGVIMKQLPYDFYGR